MRDLLASLDQMGAGQADRAENPLHAYIPAGPVDAAPYVGYCPPEVRQEAFSAVLEGIEMGAYDTQIVNWLTVVPFATLAKIMSPPKIPSNRFASHIAIVLTAPQNAGARSRAAMPSRVGPAVQGSCMVAVMTTSSITI
jgi:hypothetical protein